MEKRKEKEEKKIWEDQVEGRNSVLELLESGKDVNKIFVTQSFFDIILFVRKKKIVVIRKK